MLELEYVLKCIFSKIYKEIKLDFANKCSMEKALKYLEMFYLSVTNNKSLLKKFLQENELSPLSINIQEKILACTIKSSFVKKYHPPVSYQKFFLRTLIDTVESSSCELSDSLIEAYANILSQPSNDKCVYRSYIIKDDCVITLQESHCFVENSTTGLQTWEAAKYLLEWCLENASLFEKKRILELGSGIGLLGITISKMCQPDKYLFSDKSLDVLDILAKNIEINLDENSIEDITEKHQLLWGALRPDDAKSLTVDILLGADIVFDPSIIQSLVDTMKTFLTHGGAKCAYIANTIRNTDTNECFTSELNAAGLQFEILDFCKNYKFIYIESSKFILYKIFLSEN